MLAQIENKLKKQFQRRVHHSAIAAPLAAHKNTGRGASAPVCMPVAVRGKIDDDSESDPS